MTRLLALGIAAVLGMAVAMPLLTGALGPAWGLGLGMALYWLGFCIPMALSAGRAGLRRRMALSTGGRPVYWALLAAQVAAVAVVSALILPEGAPAWIFPVALAAALVNGTLEEAAWRAAPLEVMAGRIGPFVAMQGLFGLWHVSLGLAQGIQHHGGMANLVAGGLGLGAFWAVIAWRTGRAGPGALAHVLTNAVAFPVSLALTWG